MIAGLALLALVLCAAWSRRDKTSALLLGVASVVWVLLDHPMEGRVLITVARGHGLTAADVPGLVCLGIACRRWWMADQVDAATRSAARAESQRDQVR